MASLPTIASAPSTCGRPSAPAAGTPTGRLPSPSAIGSDAPGTPRTQAGSVDPAGAASNQSRALPLISGQSRGPHRARLRGGVESPRLVRPSVFLARSARLARYAVAQRVQNSRVWPHNGLRMRPTYETAAGCLLPTAYFRVDFRPEER